MERGILTPGRLEVVPNAVLLPEVKESSGDGLTSSVEKETVESFGVSPDRIHLIRGAGVDVEHFHPAPAESAPSTAPLRVCVLSRMLFEKGIVETVAAAEKIQADRDDMEILFAGESDTESPGGIPVARQKRSLLPFPLARPYCCPHE